MLFEFGFITVSQGSLESGIAVMCRGLAVALPGILVMASTDPTDLADALGQKARLPHNFVLGTLAAMRLVGLMVEEWRTLGMARRARGVGAAGGPLGRVRAGIGQAFALLVQAVRRATRLAVTMEARGFGGQQRTWARESRYSMLDVWVVLGALVIGAGSITAGVAAGTWRLVGS
jgi:energy-coupling factor transport system permease protein